MKWQLQEAKARFSEVIKRAAREGAQTVTVHGKETAVVLSIEDYRRLGGRHADFADRLLKGPRITEELAAAITDRPRGLPRDAEL
jgi:prevent-host-death family protein